MYLNMHVDMYMEAQVHVCTCNMDKINYIMYIHVHVYYKLHVCTCTYIIHHMTNTNLYLYLTKFVPQKDASMVKLLATPSLHTTTLPVDSLHLCTANLQLLNENLSFDCKMRNIYTCTYTTCELI